MKKITQILQNRQRQFVLGGSLAAVSGVSSAVSYIPANISTLFTDLGTDVGTLTAAGAVLFGLIRGGTAILKIASRFFGAAGA